MIVHRKFYLLVVIVGLMVTACAPASSVAPAVTFRAGALVARGSRRLGNIQQHG
jgi:hypothetical protein